MITYKDQNHTQGDRFCIIERLLGLGADVLATDTSGNSIMDLVCSTGSLGEDERVDLLSLFLRYHPDMSNRSIELSAWTDYLYASLLVTEEIVVNGASCVSWAEW